MSEKLPFTEDDISILATDRSFERGEQYYSNGLVGKISRTGNLFESEVLGSHLYKVSLDIEDNVMDFSCSCPYDWGGICKHQVAFALAILDNNNIYYIEKAQVTNRISDDKEFKELFGKIKNSFKNKFLEQLLKRDSDLRGQFSAFVKNDNNETDTPKKIDEIFGENIETIKTDIFDELTILDFDDLNDFDEYNRGYNYYEDYYGYDAACELIKKVFQPYQASATEYIKKGNLVDSIRIILGMYEGSQNLPEPEYSEYEIFDDYNYELKSLFEETMTPLVTEIKKSVKSEENIKKTIDLIIDRFLYYENQPVKEKEKENSSIKYDLKIFEKLFISLIINKEIGEHFLKSINDNELVCVGLSFILLEIAEQTSNEKLWLATAEEFAGSQQLIAQKLLDKYLKQNDETNFNRIAKKAFKAWADSFDFYLVSNLNIESDKTLYIKALKNYTTKKTSLKYYKILRNYYSQSEKENYVNQIGNSYNKVFYVGILEIEERFDDILKLAEREINNDDNLHNFIKPIVNKFPKKCFAMVLGKCEKAINSSDKGRKTYKKMAKWLKELTKVEAIQVEFKTYLKTLYHRKPNHPALKDEMRKANLIKTD